MCRKEKHRWDDDLKIELTPTEFLEMANDALRECGVVTIVGEVASFKVSQGKWVFFDLKDEESSVACFVPLRAMRIPLEDGMKVRIKGVPKVTKWGKFSVTIMSAQLVGEGSLKKAYEMLKQKLTKEGLFDRRKKRPLPEDLMRIGVISSTQAAGYADFVKIINARWGGMKIQVAHCQVQGMDAPDQMIRALRYFNERSEVQIIAMLRGGGSADDLACFNDEKLVREIAASRIPVITGVGHEIDETLADLAADIRASTPSNAAEMLSKDRRAVARDTVTKVVNLRRVIIEKAKMEQFENRQKVERISEGLIGKYIAPMERENREKMQKIMQKIQDELRRYENDLAHQRKVLEVLNPEKVLSQGYAILAGKLSPGNVVKITTFTKEIKAEVKEVHERT